MTAGVEARRRLVPGVVLSAKMDKTITVLVERRVKHPLYGKYVRRMTKLYAHDEENSCRETDRVMIEECRPVSSKKCWRLVEILESSA